MKVYATFPENYSLLDAGNGFKLEKWGEVITIRPENQAYFKAEKNLSEWRKTAHWEFVPQSEAALNGKWKQLKPNAPNSWLFESHGCTFHLEITSNKHLGCFPEQNINWEFITEFLSPEKRFLNAFAYTGVASVIARNTDAEVVHCDSIKGMIDWASKNQALSNLDGIKWVVEDALKFIDRELKRGNKYDLIQLDPPAWGIGAKKEKWKLETLLPQLIKDASQLLNPKGCLLINTYSPKLTLDKMNTICAPFSTTFQLENNELWMKSQSEKDLFYGLRTVFHKKD